MNFLLIGLLLIALLTIELLCGGTRLALSIPSYGILSLAATLSFFRRSTQKVSHQTLLCLTSTAVFFGYVLLRAATSPVEYLARRDLYMVMAALIVYLLIAFTITSPKHRSLVVAFILVMAFAQCIVGAIQFAGGRNYMPFHFLSRVEQYGSRASGFYTTPNHLAGFLEIALPLGLGATFFSRWKLWCKILAAYTSLVCAIGIFLTGSRGGYFSMLLSLLAFTIFSLSAVSKQFRDRFLYIAATMIVLAIFMSFAAHKMIDSSVLIRSRVRGIGEGEVRGQFARAAWEQFKLSPLIGTGSGTFLYYARQFRTRGNEKDATYTHDDYLQLLAEYGILGMAGFIFFLTTHLYFGWKSYHELSSERSHFVTEGSNSLALTVGALSAVVAYIVHSFVDFNLHIPGNTLHIAFIFGLLANPFGTDISTSRQEASGRPIPRYLPFALPCLGLWMALVALPKYPAEFYGEKSSQALRNFNLELGDFNYNEAEKYAEMALSGEKRNPDLYYDLGEARHGLAQSAKDTKQVAKLYTEALDAYQKGMALFPQDVRLILCAAWTLDDLKRFDEAEPVFLHAMALDPNSGEVRSSYAAHLHKWGKLDEAEMRYKEAISLSNSASAQYGLLQLASDRKAKQSEEAAPVH